MPRLTTSYTQDLALLKTSTQRVAVVVAALLLVAVPFVLPSFYVTVLNLSLLAVLGALALNLVLGVAGQVSLANAALMAVGAYTAAALGGTLHLPFVISVIGGGGAGAIVGAIVGMPALRLRGIYLAIATLALHYIVVYVGREYQTAAAGPAGFLLPRATLGPLTIADERSWYWLLLPVAAGTYLGMINLIRSPFGRAWRAQRDGEIAAAILGIDVARYKVLAFVLSSFVVSFMGGLLAYYQSAVSYDGFTLSLAISYAAMVIVGGMGSMPGSVLGAFLLTSMPFALQNVLRGLPTGVQQLANINLLIYGSAIAAFLLWEPGGLVEILSRIKAWLVRWPYGRPPAIREPASPIRTRQTEGG